MAYQMAQTLVTLNDLEGHFSYLTLFNSVFGKYDTCIKFVNEIRRAYVAYDLE